jgi:hypothetical protein
MDNFSSHKVTGIREAIESVGAHLIYLSPYSPDFSQERKFLVKNQRIFTLPLLLALTLMRDKAITEAFETINLSDIIAWFKPQWLLYCSQLRTAICSRQLEGNPNPLQLKTTKSLIWWGLIPNLRKARGLLDN